MKMSRKSPLHLTGQRRKHVSERNPIASFPVSGLESTARHHAVPLLMKLAFARIPAPTLSHPASHVARWHAKARLPLSTADSRRQRPIPIAAWRREIWAMRLSFVRILPRQHRAEDARAKSVRDYCVLAQVSRFSYGWMRKPCQQPTTASKERATMNSRAAGFSLTALAIMMTLSACSPGGGADNTPSITSGTIELAVTETCTGGSDAKCVSVDGVNVVLPAAFAQAGVEEATAAEGQGPHAVDVTFTKEGATVLHNLTEQAAQAGNSARLVIKVGGEMQAAVTVMEAVNEGQLQMSFSPNTSAQEAIDLIQGN